MSQPILPGTLLKDSRPGRKPYLTLDFSGEARTRKQWRQRQQIRDSLIPYLNEHSQKIAEEIANAIEHNLPGQVELKVEIQFRYGSIEWAGMILVLDAVGKVVDGVAFTKLVIDTVRFCVNKVLGEKITAQQHQLRSIDTRVEQRKTDSIDVITRALWWCSGANINVLRSSPTDKAKYIGIGGAVLSTWILATLSGGYALNTMFEGSEWQGAASVAFGLLWGLIIFNLDRFIVSTMVKPPSNPGVFNTVRTRVAECVPAAPRFLLAGVLALTISVPIEMRLFSSTIDSRIEFNSDALLQQREGELDKVLKSRADAVTKELGDIREAIKARREYAEGREKAYLEETDGTGGSGRYGYSTVAKLKGAQYRSALEEYNNAKEGFSDRIASLQRAMDAIAEEKRTALLNYRESLGKGFLDRYRALSDLSSDNVAIRWVTYAVLLLFFVIEITPILVKLLSNYGPYDAKLALQSDAEIKEAELRKNSRVEIAGFHYKYLTEAERQVEELFFDRSVAIRKQKVLEAWEIFERTFSSRPQVSVEELLTAVRDSFYINRSP